MQFLSYVVEAPDEVLLPEHHLALGPGVNAFNVLVPDPTEFRSKLEKHGVRITREFPLDDLGPLPAEVILETLPEVENIPLLANRNSDE